MSPFGEYAPARMKGSIRAKSKLDDGVDGYVGAAEPRNKWLKDIVRCTVLVEARASRLICAQREASRAIMYSQARVSLPLTVPQDHAKPVEAHGALAKAYTLGSTKDRRESLPRDVLQLIWCALCILWHICLTRAAPSSTSLCMTHGLPPSSCLGVCTGTSTSSAHSSARCSSTSKASRPVVPQRSAWQKRVCRETAGSHHIRATAPFASCTSPPAHPAGPEEILAHGVQHIPR